MDTSTITSPSRAPAAARRARGRLRFTAGASFVSLAIHGGLLVGASLWMWGAVEREEDEPSFPVAWVPQPERAAPAPEPVEPVRPLRAVPEEQVIETELVAMPLPELVAEAEVVEDEPPSVAPLADATADIERALDTPWTARSGSRANTGMGVGSGGVAGASPRAMSGTGDGKLDGTGSSSNPADPPIAEASAPPPPRAPVLVAALLIEQPRPVYPRASLRANEQGSVLLRLHVGADGAVGEVEVVEPSGFPRLDEAALAGVKLWRFRPATSDGVAIASLVLHRVTFKMSEAPR